MKLEIIAIIGLVITTCQARTLTSDDEDSVVSIYTTVATELGPVKHLNVYEQIANNLADRITSPFYRFFGIGKNNTEAKTRRTWDNVELVDETPEEAPENNEIERERDVEELSTDAAKKSADKPEKITLHSHEETEVNRDFDEESFEFDDTEVKEEKSTEGGLLYFLELIGSFIQLAWGALQQLFIPKSSS